MSHECANPDVSDRKYSCKAKIRTILTVLAALASPASAQRATLRDS
jgi:hypothetical protein